MHLATLFVSTKLQNFIFKTVFLVYDLVLM